MKNGLAFVFKNGCIKFLKSYSYISNYKPEYRETPKSKYIKINLTDDIKDGCDWVDSYLIKYAYNNLKGVMNFNKELSNIIIIDTDILKRFIKIKKIKNKCQQEKINL